VDIALLRNTIYPFAETDRQVVFFWHHRQGREPMPGKQTEQRHAQAEGLDLRTDGDILALLAQGQAEAARCVGAASPAIAAAAVLAARSIRNGGRLIYAAAGSSGLMALADALELPGTYGIAREKIVVSWPAAARHWSTCAAGRRMTVTPPALPWKALSSPHAIA
jgi:hypothetical protein